MTLQTDIIPACYRSVLFRVFWVQQLRGITSKVERKPRRFFAIDETKHEVNRKQLFVWSGIDIETKQLLADTHHTRGHESNHLSSSRWF